MLAFIEAPALYKVIPIRSKTALETAVLDELGKAKALVTRRGNRILLAGRIALPPLAEVRRNAAQWDAKLALLGVSSNQLLPRFRPQPAASGVRVLTDQYSPSNLLLR